jgi:alpha-tubulin suppressor-like RCC1 family protein
MFRDQTGTFPLAGDRFVHDLDPKDTNINQHGDERKPGKTNLRHSTKEPSHMNLIPSFSSLARFSIFVGTDNSVYSWGTNTKGTLGLGTYNTGSITPQKIHGLPPNTNVVQAACGAQHTLLLTSDQKIFVFGLNDSGQLGIGGMENKNAPVELVWKKKEKPVKVACGALHSGLVTENGEVFMWGYNNAGQLGVGAGIFGVTTPRKTEIPEFVTDLACGFYHSLALTQSGNVYSWGTNKFGALGIRSTENQVDPVRNPYLRNVIRIACGTKHSVALTADGEVLTWGNPFAIGREGSNFANFQPTVVAKEVLEIAAGGEFCLVQLKNSRFLFWGKNSYGQLPSNSENNINAPEIFPALDVLNSVVSFGAGWDHTFMVLEDGTICTWGVNTEFQLGHSNSKTPTVSNFSVCAQKIPRNFNAYVFFKWERIFRLLFLGRGDKVSEFFGLPIEVIYNILEVEICQ